MLPEKVMIKEVGPRDGLQNEPEIIPTDIKLKWIEKLKESGLSYIEATSFVHPKWMPQLSDASDLLSKIDFNDDITYAALVPNLKGLSRAKDTPLNEIAVFISASELHNQKNLNKSIDASMDEIKEVIQHADGLKVRAYISMVFGSPFGDEVSLQTVIDLMHTLYDLGVYEISLGDTTGMANPIQVSEYLSQLIHISPKEKIAMHFHDTNGLALANIYASLEKGITVFDSASGGLGGCPYAEGASGNVATEDVLYLMNALSIETNINMEKLLEAGQLITSYLNHYVPSAQMRKFKGKYND